MDKTYILLRNKKQIGPYNREQLTQVGLLPTDLVWIQGKSTTWQSSNAIDELKPILGLANNRFSTVNTTDGISYSNEKPESFSLLNTETTPLVQRSLKYTYARYPVMVDLPKLQDIQPEYTQTPPKKLVDVNHINSSTINSNKQVVSNTPPYRSPEEIKNEYDLWLQQNNNQQKGTSKKRVGAMMFAVMISSLTFLWKGIKAKSTLAGSVANHQLK